MIRCKNNHGEIVELPRDKFKPRPSVYAILRRGDSILICRTKSNGKIWFPGGGADDNETHEQTLLRECREETGIENIKIKQLLATFQNYFYYEPEDLAMDADLYFYECITDQKDLKTNEEIDDREATDLEWLRIDQIRKDDISDLNERIYKMLNSLD